MLSRTAVGMGKRLLYLIELLQSVDSYSYNYTELALSISFSGVAYPLRSIFAF